MALKFHIDAIHKTNITGWVFNEQDQEQSRRLLLEMDGVLVADTFADIFRKSLKERRLHNTGRCGFSIPFSRAKKDSHLRLIDFESKTELFTAILENFKNVLFCGSTLSPVKRLAYSVLAALPDYHYFNRSAKILEKEYQTLDPFKLQRITELKSNSLLLIQHGRMHNSLELNLDVFDLVVYVQPTAQNIPQKMYERISDLCDKQNWHDLQNFIHSTYNSSESSFDYIFSHLYTDLHNVAMQHALDVLPASKVKKINGDTISTDELIDMIKHIGIE